MGYSKKTKDIVMLRMLPPINQSIQDIHKETGISHTTLIRWCEELKPNLLERDIQNRNVTSLEITINLL